MSLWVCRTCLSAWLSNTPFFLDIIFLLGKKGSPDRQEVQREQILISFNARAMKTTPALNEEVDNNFILKVGGARTLFRVHQQPV